MIDPDMESKEDKRKMPKITKVKNKMPAPVQITAEQLLREAKERDLQSKKYLILMSCKPTDFAKERARSVYERALDVDHRNITLWLKYAEMEMRMRQINHARNIWDRAITVLPRANQFWYKYTYMEEMLGNIAGCRQVKNWIKYARFEQKNSYINSARSIYERAIEYFGEDNMDEKLIIAFSKFEEGQKEHERARVIYKYALDHLPKDKCQEIYKNYTVHEKKFGSRAAIEDVIVSKRRFQYEEEVKSNPLNYDAWFDYLRLMEDDGNVDHIRDTYERAIANIPPAQELEMEDAEKTRAVYKACLDIIPHKKFTFAKIWLLFAQFELRQKNLVNARKILGVAIGKCPKNKLFRGYIDMELQLREFERCRILYEKFLEFETILGDADRARAIYELAIAQTKLDMPEVLWKAYIDFEIEQEEFNNTRNLYKRLLQRTQHVKVWISYAQFEKTTGEVEYVKNTRRIFQEAAATLKKAEEKEERLMILESWQAFEAEHGDDESRSRVEKLLPQKVKKRRKIQTDDGSDAGWEEYYDYIFPDETAAQPNLKLLAMAKKWKKAQDTDETAEEEAGASREDNPEESHVAMETEGD
ncbi:CRNL1-like protein [Mya arenaria]|uniref:CRNL1-like protein n=1 Tax=Mya arenaria TaxID=6604 RepID=A0ABY7FGL3_MYAAR|nr:CRNL1-like protein [Mya arenaria]WAR18371.1 CRNL1-like protein [Mya arenaria]